MTIQLYSDPLTVQDRLKDMQSLLILKNIRGHHDSDPTVLRAIDHAIDIIKQRSEKREAKSGSDDFRLSFLRNALAQVERGDASITNVGVDREVEMINVSSISGSSQRMSAGRGLVTYKIEIVGQLDGKAMP